MSARQVATRVLFRVAEDGAYAMPTLDAEIRRAELSRRDAALATEIVYGTLRVLPRLDRRLDAYLRRPRKTDAWLRAALRGGAYQLLHLARVPPHATVSETVAVVKRERGPRLGGVANAVLRKLALERPESPERPSTLALPDWLSPRLTASLGEDRARVFAEARRLPPPLGLRASGDPAALAERLRSARPEAEIELVGERGLSVRGAGDPRELPGYEVGEFAVQELGAQQIIELVEVAAGERIADLCAGHGTKTLALAQRVGDEGRVDAVDLYEEKLERISGEAMRLGIPLDRVRTHAVDLSVGLGGLEERSYDRVLLDAPCSGLGTVHRRPELLLRLSPTDPARLARLQLRLLHAAAQLPKTGGTLVYAVCSLTAEEGDGVAEAFEAECPDFTREADLFLGPWDGELDAYRVFRWRLG